MSAQAISEINNAIGAHGVWKLKLRTAIATGASDIEPKTVRCDDKCALGQWLYGSTGLTRLGDPGSMLVHGWL